MLNPSGLVLLCQGQWPSSPSSVFGDDNVENPPVLISPIKRRTRNAAPGINKQSDIDVWGLSDAEILGKSSFIKYLVH